MMTRANIMVLLLFMLIMPGNVFASSWVGIVLETEDYELKITYSISSDYEHDLAYMRDPSKLLFDLIVLFQKNYEKLSKAKGKYWIDIEGEKPYISTLKYVNDPKNPDENGYSPYDEITYSSLDSSVFQGRICKVIPLDECSLNNSDKTTYLYYTENLELAEKAGRIKFEALPSEIYPPYFTLRPLKGHEDEFYKIPVKNDDMNKYFRWLID